VARIPQPCAAAHDLLTFTEAQATAGPHSSWQASPLLRDQTNESSAAAKTPAYHQHPGTDARGNQPPRTRALPHTRTADVQASTSAPAAPNQHTITDTSVIN
jgi:hypothetical protein